MELIIVKKLGIKISLQSTVVGCSLYKKRSKYL